MPKGLKRALAAAKRQDSDVEEDEDAMMELEAAKRMMEEQSAEREQAQHEVAQAKAHAYNKAGLLQMLKQVSRELPWPETLTITGIPLELEDVHDDLQREVAFYNNALEAVNQAKDKLKAEGLPYKRPADFFCEMVKSDAHMAKIKDKLIFEQAKMDAFQQRKARSEQRKYAKEVSAEKQKEKSAKKKEALDAVAQWRKDAKAKGGAGGPLPDNDGLDDYLSGKKRARDSTGGPPNKRAAKDKKFGFGGVPGRIKKANDKKSVNDFSTFNPKKGTMVMKKGKGKGKGAPNKGGSRPGKSTRQKARGKK
eukprot:TRINITY_DN9546_c0_g1_i1.p1 TRINITY_DN9546_c0_g1~~TRINITY_DN9546_c0_g1_i1.p1  ORF type:complete len:308 (+),score=113.87 TRINITY_DN9546_c0_g1_i1:207-1130(+)